MGKGNRNRKERQMEDAIQDTIDLASAMGAHPDPTAPIKAAPRQADGMPPPELIDEFISDARSQGCTCIDPKVRVYRSVSGQGGTINLLHEDHCPLIRVLDEQAR